GTMVSAVASLVPEVPCYIVKKSQVLISLSSLDFSFMVEDNIAEIFQLLALYKLKVDLIQNSAISFSLCVDNKFNGLEKLVNQLKGKFKVTVTPNVHLYTIRHFNQNALDNFQEGKEVLLKQVTQNTVQLVTQN
ncbi:MAG: aspartate kinase, partial [Dokdonia donghaensis]|nr:aspartate kinase [Dokdonia donghaensis]